jgi:outer membrane receptor for ferric coprogen and ferric-rhodotorulic acid
MTCLLAKALLSFQLTPNTQLQTDGYYISDQLTAQGEIQNRYSVNVGIAQYLLKKKLKASLSVNNIFDSMEERTRIQTSSFQQIQIRNRDSRVTWLTLSYNL